MFQQKGRLEEAKKGFSDVDVYPPSPPALLQIRFLQIAYLKGLTKPVRNSTVYFDNNKQLLSHPMHFFYFNFLLIVFIQSIASHTFKNCTIKYLSLILYLSNKQLSFNCNSFLSRCIRVSKNNLDVTTKIFAPQNIQSLKSLKLQSF